MAIKLPSFLNASKIISKKKDIVQDNIVKKEIPLEKDEKENFAKRLYEPQKQDEPSIERVPNKANNENNSEGFKQITNAIQNNASIQNSHDTQSVSYLKRISDDLYGIKNFLFKMDFDKDTDTNNDTTSGSILDILGSAKDFFKKSKKVPKGLSKLTKTGNTLAKSTINKPVSFAQNSLSKVSKLTSSVSDTATNSISKIKNISIKNNSLKNIGNISKVLADKGSPIMRTAGQMLARSAPALVEGAVAAAPYLAVATAGYVGYKAGEQLNKAMEGTEIGAWKDKLFDSIFSGIDDLTGGLLSGVDPSKRKQAEESDKKKEDDKETLFEKLNENLDSLSDQIKASMGDIEAQDRIFARSATGQSTTTDKVAGSIREGVADLTGIKEGSTSRGGKEFKDKSVMIMDNLMKDFQLTPEQAAGVMGNLGHESGGLKQMQEINPTSGRGGLGWAQWTGDRRKKFEAYAAAHGLSTSSDEANYGYLKEELTTGAEKGAIDRVKQSSDLKGAVYNFERGFERSGDVKNGQVVKPTQYQSRYDYANTALAAYNEAKGIKTSNEVSAKIANETVSNLNSTLVQDTQNAIDRGVKYNYGSKNSSSGSIDCSGWVMELNKKMSSELGDPDTIKQAVNTMDKGAAQGGAAGIIQAVGQATGKELSGNDVNAENLREGMVIGIDHSQSGAKSGAGRYKGIDHITQVVKNPETGEMMISESSSKKGVHLTNANDWLERNKDKPKYAVDPYANIRGEDGTIQTETKPKSIMYDSKTANQYLSNNTQGISTQYGDNNKPVEYSSFVPSTYNQQNFANQGQLNQVSNPSINTGSYSNQSNNIAPYNTISSGTTISNNEIQPVSSMVNTGIDYSTKNDSMSNINSVFREVSNDDTTTNTQQLSSALSSATFNIQNASINNANANINQENQQTGSDESQSTSESNITNDNTNNGYNTSSIVDNSSIINNPTGGILNSISNGIGSILNPISAITNTIGSISANPISSIIGAFTNSANTNQYANNISPITSNLSNEPTSILQNVLSSGLGGITNVAGGLLNSIIGTANASENLYNASPLMTNIVPQNDIRKNSDIANTAQTFFTNNNEIGSKQNSITNDENILSQNNSNLISSIRSLDKRNIVGSNTNQYERDLIPQNNTTQLLNNGINLTRQIGSGDIIGTINNGSDLLNSLSQTYVPQQNQSVTGRYDTNTNNYSLENSLNPNNSIFNNSLSRISATNEGINEYEQPNVTTSATSFFKNERDNNQKTNTLDNYSSQSFVNETNNTKNNKDNNIMNTLSYDTNNITNKLYDNKLERQDSNIGDFITNKTIETDSVVAKRNTPPITIQQPPTQVIQQSGGKTGTVAPMRTKPNDSALRRIFDNMLAQGI
ncbi:MAG: phage tail tip lysozyme [Flavobacterium sp.]|uniref:phage tail tip lysozyme n=1 Tax=Flavobacterium sp. TaxID=239 RepID=UPI00261D128B|nr:phage tail tip lysozyme [Flavobacterium sp.]MDD5150665.1 phage tail tip lysozyme [Flavobacterium sp.]